MGLTSMDKNYEKSEIGSSIKNEDDTKNLTMTHTDVQLYLIFQYIMIKISKERINLNLCKYMYFLEEVYRQAILA